MEKEFLKYPEALALKELGFDEPCLGLFLIETKKLCFFDRPMNYADVTKDIWIKSPLYRQAFRWFREKYNLEHNIISDMLGYASYIIQRTIPLKQATKPSNIFQYYEEAELACLQSLIKLAQDEINTIK